MSVVRLTLDTNLLLEYWKQQDRRTIVEQLIALSRSGYVDLVVTARIREDIPRPPLAEHIDRLAELGVEEGASVTRLGMWVLNRDMLGDDGFIATAEQFDRELTARGRNPPDWRDWDHLHAHFLSGRDVFLTWDQRILEIASELRERLNIRVTEPEAWLLEAGHTQPGGLE